MAPGAIPALLFLHALPLDGSMWDGQRGLAPAASYAPTLYKHGDTIEAWAAAALRGVKEERIIVIGCSVGGSCALEVAKLAPERVAALVLIGTKAHRRPDAALHHGSVDLIRNEGLAAAWGVYWARLFSNATPRQSVEAARQIMLRHPTSDIVRGVNVFHSRPSRDQVLSEFPGEIIVITGAEDGAPGIKTSVAQAHAARRGTLHVIADCGHYVPLEQPGQLNDILSGLIGRVIRQGPMPETADRP